MFKAAICSWQIWLLFVVANLISIVYFGRIASPVYTSKVKFAAAKLLENAAISQSGSDRRKREIQC